MTTPAQPWTVPPGTSLAVRQRLEELSGQHRESTARAVRRSAVAALEAHRSRLATSVNLYAGGNVMSPDVTALHDTALAPRAAMGWPGQKVQPGLDEVEHLEVLACAQVASAMGARFAEIRFPTATMANLACYWAFAEPGNVIATLSPEAGGHSSHQGAGGTAGVRGLVVLPLPYDRTRLDVDPDRLVRLVRRHRPRMIVIGGSVALFPHDLEPVRAAADLVDAVVLYDASHTAGLIAAGVVPNPLSQGADVLTFSTYKTLAGPAGGAAVTSSPEVARRVSEAAYPVLTSNYDPSRLAPLALAAREAAEQSPAWAVATVEAARAIGEHLAERGVGVLGRDRGYTRTHQVVLDARGHGGGPAAAAHLERFGVLSGACRLPDQGPRETAGGLRIGTQEVVRLGLGPAGVVALADLLGSALTGAGDAVVRAGVAAVRRSMTADIWGRPSAGGSTA